MFYGSSFQEVSVHYVNMKLTAVREGAVDGWAVWPRVWYGNDCRGGKGYHLRFLASLSIEDALQSRERKLILLALIGNNRANRAGSRCGAEGFGSAEST
jgi:hypothetical protein